MSPGPVLAGVQSTSDIIVRMFTVILNSKMADSSDGDSKLIVGHEGAGDDCIGKIIDKTGKFFLAGKFEEMVSSLAGHWLDSVRTIWITLLPLFPGGAIGATEGCFLTPIPGNTTPLIFRCLALMLQRSILLGNYVVSRSQTLQKGKGSGYARLVTMYMYPYVTTPTPEWV